MKPASRQHVILHPSAWIAAQVPPPWADSRWECRAPVFTGPASLSAALPWGLQAHAPAYNAMAMASAAARGPTSHAGPGRAAARAALPGGGGGGGVFFPCDVDVAGASMRWVHRGISEDVAVLGPRIDHELGPSLGKDMYGVGGHLDAFAKLPVHVRRVTACWGCIWPLETSQVAASHIRPQRCLHRPLPPPLLTKT